MAQLEVWSPRGPALMQLETAPVSIGKGTTNDLVLAEDDLASRLHAVLERYGGGWSITDLSSTNGTILNGERILTECPLRDGDEIRIGRTRIRFLSATERGTATPTAAADPSPRITPRERDVLIELCRPTLSADLFTGPATVAEIAERLVLSNDAVRQHVTNLAKRFAVTSRGERRRIDLANEAIRRRAITLADIR